MASFSTLCHLSLEKRNIPPHSIPPAPVFPRAHTTDTNTLHAVNLHMSLVASPSPHLSDAQMSIDSKMGTMMWDWQDEPFLLGGGGGQKVIFKWKEKRYGTGPRDHRGTSNKRAVLMKRISKHMRVMW